LRLLKKIKMPKAYLRIIDLKPTLMKALVFTKFRKVGEPLEREMLFQIKNRFVYDELFNNLDKFIKVGISFGAVFNIYDTNEDLDRLRKVTNIIL